MTHFAAARLLERSFDPGDLERSLKEYERAAALTPYNYLMWLNVGRLRGLNGDTDGALAAYRRSLELAPNYSSVQWALGNALVRNGDTDEGFKLIAKAAASDTQFARPAISLALQMFEGDVARARQLLGDSDLTNSAVAVELSRQGKFTEAVDAWNRVSPEAKRQADLTKAGETISGQMLEAKKYMLAARVLADLPGSESWKPGPGVLNNGGFENGVKMRNAGTFEWQIAEGGDPQIALSTTQKHSGTYSLWLTFNSMETAAFRTISQTVPVEPGREYEFEVFYRSDVKTDSEMKWEIVDPVASAVIASTPKITPAGDWATLMATFKVPQGTDGVIIRFVRQGCGGPACPTSGRLAFDDVSLRAL
jgi:hypothetical protein